MCLRAVNLDEFLNLGCLTNSVTEVVQLSTANLTQTDNVYLSYVRRVEGEGLFNAAAVCNTANGEGFGDTAAMLSDYGAFEKLDSFTVTFFDKVVNADGVTHVEGRNGFLQLLRCKSLEFGHFNRLHFKYFSDIRTELRRGLSVSCA